MERLSRPRRRHSIRSFVEKYAHANDHVSTSLNNRDKPRTQFHSNSGLFVWNIVLDGRTTLFGSKSFLPLVDGALMETIRNALEPMMTSTIVIRGPYEVGESKSFLTIVCFNIQFMLS
jgi:hypothetical protein